MDVLDDAIAELEARLNLKPGQPIFSHQPAAAKAPKKKAPKPAKAAAPANNMDQPDICKLEFKVGVITKVWVHEKADKLYCEEIDVGEATPRQIASGLRPHFSLEQMLGQRLLVMANLKPKNLVGFKSHGMVLCAAETLPDGSEKVEFVEPPAGAAVGEVVTFDGLPKPEPISAAQVDKKKVLQAVADGMKTTEDCVAVYETHKFMTSAGPCTVKTIKGGALR